MEKNVRGCCIRYVLREVCYFCKGVIRFSFTPLVYNNFLSNPFKTNHHRPLEVTQNWRKGIKVDDACYVFKQKSTTVLQ